MAYYLIKKGISGHSVEGEPFVEILDRPISWVEKLRLGRGIFRPKLIEVDVHSHELVRVTALRNDVQLVIKKHKDYRNRETGVVDLNFPITNPNVPEGSVYEVELQKGGFLNLNRSSFAIKGRTEVEQVRWSSSLGGPGDDMFSDLCVETISSLYSE